MLVQATTPRAWRARSRCEASPRLRLISTEPVTPPPGSGLEKPVTDSDAGDAAELAIAAMRAALMRFAEFNPAMKLDAKI